MLKSVITATPKDGGRQLNEEWLDVEHLAHVEVTSENPGFPIESVFDSVKGPGWRAAKEGQQLIRLVFDEPKSIHRIQLHFSETEVERTQEFTLRWAAAEGGGREFMRQQWNFSPQGSMSEVEDYRVDLTGVSVLELTLKPDLSRGKALASLAQWRVA